MRARAAGYRLWRILDAASTSDWIRSVGIALVSGGFGGRILREVGADWPLTAVVAVGIGLIMFASVMAALSRRAAEPTVSATKPRPSGQAEVPSLLYELYVLGSRALDAAATILNHVWRGMFTTSDQAKRDLAVVVQQRIDDAIQKRSLAANAIEHSDGTDPEAALGDFHRSYQGVRTWVAKSFTYELLPPEMPNYRRWREADEKFLNRLQDVTAHREFSTLRKSVQGAGLGEGVTDSLPEPQSK